MSRFDPRRHDEQITRWSRIWVPIGVRRTARNKERTACRYFDVAVVDSYPKRALKDVPGFVVFVMDVQRSDELGWIIAATGIRPLDDDQTAGRNFAVAERRREQVAGELWSCL
jgi:hypothetical protein